MKNIDSQIENARGYLMQLKKLEKMIKNKLFEKEHWKSVALGTTAQMGGERVQSSSSQQKMADAVAKYMDMDAEIDRAIDALVDKRNEVISVIEKLPVVQYDLLHKVYVQYKTLDEVAELYDRSQSWAKNVHRKALRNVHKILVTEQKCPKLYVFGQS